MDTPTLCFVAVLLGLATLATTNPPETLETSTGGAIVESDAQNVLEECKHTDYRTYIKCLKRQKRHHFPHSDFDHHCLESCPKKCYSEHECELKCGHCIRRTKHKHQIITEYETECSGSGECRNTTTPDKELPSTNITTKIDIHNVINNNLTTTCTTPDCATTRPPFVPPSIVPPTIIPPTGPPTSPPIIPPPVPPTGVPPSRPNIPYDCLYPPPFPCYPPSYPNYPQQPAIQQISSPLLLALPITTGIGVGFGGYQNPCMYSNQWPCLPNWGWGHGTSIDCSGCWIPHYRYKCDVYCYNYKPPSSCTSPGCVGGTILNR